MATEGPRLISIVRKIQSFDENVHAELEQVYEKLMETGAGLKVLSEESCFLSKTL